MITLTAAQLRDALAFCNPDEEDLDQLETEVTFFYRDEEGLSPDGELLRCGNYCYLTDCPNEGCYGPLGEGE